MGYDMTCVRLGRALLTMSLPLVAASCRRAPPPPMADSSPAVPGSVTTVRADSIVLERTACFGTCPAYRLSVTASGRVVMTPRPSGRGPTAMRVGTDSLPPAVFTRLLAAADSAGFFALPDATRSDPVLCPRARTDAPSVIVTVYLATGLKRVTHDTGCDGADSSETAAPVRRFEAFAAAMDREAGTSRWRSAPGGP